MDLTSSSIETPLPHADRRVFLAGGLTFPLLPSAWPYKSYRQLCSILEHAHTYKRNLNNAGEPLSRRKSKVASCWASKRCIFILSCGIMILSRSPSYCNNEAFNCGKACWAIGREFFARTIEITWGEQRVASDSDEFFGTKNRCDN